jgi:ACS family tartrate transporter-like MFS transporter
LVYFLAVTGLYGFNIWFPTILKRATGLPNLAVTSLAAMPYVVGLILIIWIGWHSDRARERRWHTAAPILSCGVFLALAVGFRSNIWISLGSLVFAGACTTAFMPSFWALPAAVLTDSAAAASIGFINSVGNLGGFAGPYVIGYLGTLTHSFTWGLVALIAALLGAGIIVLRLRISNA